MMAPKSEQLTIKTFMVRPFWLTIKQFFKSSIHRPQTILYPWEKQILPDVFRGRPGLVFDKCIGCGICMRLCPTRCIDMVEVDDLKCEEGKEPAKVKRPRVNVGRCMMCGYCAEYCPTKSMVVTPEFELASFTREEMIYDPYRLQWDAVPGNEVHILEVLPSELGKNVAPRESTENREVPVLEEKKCISCQRCAKVCPTDAVAMVDAGVNDKGRAVKKPKFDAMKCVACSNCVEACPKDCLELKEVS